MKRFLLKKPMAFFLSLCLLLITSVAFAAPTQNLTDSLLEEGIDASDVDVLSHLMTVEKAEQALDVEITLEGLYFDGTKLLIGWRTENLCPESPALVLYTEVLVDGVTIDADADHPTSRWWPSMFGLFVDGDPINNLMGRFIVEDVEPYGLQGTVEVTACFVVKRPTKPMVIVDPEIHIPYDDPETEADRQAMLKALQANGVTIAEPDDLDAEHWQDRGYLVVDRHGEHYLADESEGRSALTGLDLPDTAEEEIVLTFEVDLDSLRKGDGPSLGDGNLS